VGHVSAPRRRRNHNFDLNPKRRKEIVQHALLVGAMDTEDRSRWLIAWHWHNRKATDPIWSLMEAAKRMGGKITEAEASAITKEASITPKHLTADNLARFLGVTYEQRQALGFTTIGSVNVGKRARKELRKRKDRLDQKSRRRERGARPQSESLSRTKPWEALSMSRRTWERHRNKQRDAGDATSSAASFLNSADRLATPAGGARMAAERGFASKKARGLPSSQTATIIAFDVHATLPTELRLLALGLVEADWAINSARAAM
jgi:hypothetical protein